MSTSLQPVFDFRDEAKLYTSGYENCIPERERFDAIYGSVMATWICPYCSAVPSHWVCDDERDVSKLPWVDWEIDHRKFHLVVCGICGWWRYRIVDVSDIMDPFTHNHSAILTKRDLADDDAPLEEIKRNLQRDWRGVKYLSAKRAEDLVASVFAEHLDCEVIYSTQSVFAKDKGIDFVLVNNNTGLRYAFQVKRRLNDKTERVSAVREFVGSICLSNDRRGYYVTTAKRFTGDAMTEMTAGSENLANRNVEITLVSGDDLYRLLKSQLIRPETANVLTSKLGSLRGWLHVENPEAASKLYKGLYFSDNIKTNGFLFPEVLDIAYS